MTGSDARPFRFGVLAKAVRSRREWWDLARRVEQLGYDVLLVPDHSRPQLSPFPALVSAADATTTLHVGTLVLNSDLRNPALLAREAATTDLLTAGRLELGLGAGWMRRDYSELGIPWLRGRDRASRFEESLAIILAVLDGDERPLVREGRWYHVDGFLAEPSGHRRPPLLIGAGGARMLELAARHADIVSIGRSMSAGPTAQDGARDATATATERKLEVIRRTSGAGFDRLVLNVLVTSLAVGAAAASAAERFAAANGISVAEAVATPQHLFAGSPSDLVEKVCERRERFGISYVVVGEQDVDAFAAAVSELGCAGRRSYQP